MTKGNIYLLLGRDFRVTGRLGRQTFEELVSLTEQSKMVKNMVVAQSPIAEVKKRLCELVDLAEAGETLVILRHGRPVARLMPMYSACPFRGSMRICRSPE